MKKIRKKMFSIVILIVLFLQSLLPTVMAVDIVNGDKEFDNNTVEIKKDVNELENHNIVEQNLIAENINTECSIKNDIDNFDVLLADILSNDINIEYSSVDEIIESSEIADNKGVWVSNDDRDYVLNFINKISNNIYKYNEYGFLIKDGEKLGNDIRECYSYYTEKIEEVINSNKLIIISIDSQYKVLNGSEDGLIDIFIEENDFSLLFKDEEETKEIILLNSNKYNINNEFESLATLMNHFLELYYHNDDEFIEYIQDKINNIQLFSLNSLEMKDNNNTEEQYNVVLAGILNDEVTNIIEVNDSIENRPNSCGMWIEENSRDYVLNLINFNTQMNYGVNEDGYLIILNDNGIEEKNYNNTEKRLEEIINGDKLVIIDLNDHYTERIDNSNSIEKFIIEKNEYKKVLNTANSKIIIINSMMFNEDNIEDNEEILLSYILEEFLYNFEQDYEITNNGISLAYSGSIIGNMNSAQNVYAGPSNENYAKVGAVSSGEEIIVLEGEFGWYQIEYETSSGNKVGFVPKSTVPNVNMDDTSVPYNNGGLAFAHSKNIDVYYGYPTTDYAKVGTIYKGEGMTFLQKIDNFAYIEYATSTGTKRGLVNYADIFIVESSSVARIKRTSSAYAGPDTDFVKLGGAYYNEYVTVLEKEEDWCFVEYNTTSGRKCGYMAANDMDIFKAIYFYDFASYNGLKKATEQLNVYGGPNNNYAKLGTIYNLEVISFLRNIGRVGSQWAYVEYNTANGAKRGYVDASKIIDAQAPTIPNIPVYSNFTKSSYYPYTTYFDNDLNYYSIGNGNNTVFIVFEQHGWEDAWAADGIELVNIASDVMGDLSSFYVENPQIFDYWKVFIIPYANPDGITNGYSNNGPGRCTVEDIRQIDMNRSWPANFTPYYTSRNYTGSLSLGRKTDDDYGAGEIRGLKEFIDTNISGNSIIVDVHGWLNKTYGDLGIGRYFSDSFGFGNAGTYGSGYLIKYGESIGARSCLVELPKPVNTNSIIENNYSGKFATAIRTMLVGEKGVLFEGENVNEICKIYSTGNVNVRQAPNTSSPIVTSLSNGTIVNRVKKGVAISNGYTWDKIILSSGAEGYIATHFLQVVSTNDIIFTLNESDSAIQAIKAYLRYNNINQYNDTPTSILDEDTILSIKSFQNSNGLIQTDCLDRVTLETMGFSIDTSNRIVEDSFYNMYMNYAINYINYGSHNYPESYVYDGKTFVYGQTYSKHDEAYENTKKIETENYDSWTDEEKTAEYENIEETWNKLDEARDDFANKYPKGALALGHYLDETGTDLDLGDISSLFDIESQKGLRDNYIVRNMKVAEYFTKTKEEAEFALEYEYDVVVGDNPVQAFFKDDTYIDWYLAAHSFKMGTNASVTRNGNSYTMILNFVEKDFYDWDDDLVPFYLGKVNFVWEKDIRKLHLAGRARNFEDHAIYRIKVEWSENDTLTDDMITEF